jgi:hypothetical protein
MRAQQPLLFGTEYWKFRKLVKRNKHLNNLLMKLCRNLLVAAFVDEIETKTNLIGV